MPARRAVPKKTMAQKKSMPPKTTRTKAQWPAAAWTCACAEGDACTARSHKGQDTCTGQRCPYDVKHNYSLCGACRRHLKLKRKKAREGGAGGVQKKAVAKRAPVKKKKIAARPAAEPKPVVFTTSGAPGGRFYYNAALKLAVGPADNFDQFQRYLNGPSRRFCVASDRREVEGSAVRVPDSPDAKVEDLSAIYRELSGLLSAGNQAVYLCCNAGEVRSVSLFIRAVAARTLLRPHDVLDKLRKDYSQRVMPNRVAVTLVFGPFAGLDLLGKRR